MMNFGSKNVKGGFFGTRRLLGFYLHGPKGEVLDGQIFQTFDDIDPPETTAPPTIPPTSIGAVTVSGPTSPTEGDVLTYSVSNDGDANVLIYSWSIVGGTGSSSSANCQVTWGNDGPGQVSCTIVSTDENIQDSPASDTLNVNILSTTTPPLPLPNAPTNVSITTSDHVPPTTPAPTTTPAPGAGITPVNDNQVRFYVPASANSFNVLGMTNTGYFAISDGTNTSPVAGGNYYTGTSYFYMYGNGAATLNTLPAGDRVIRLYPTDAAGTYDPNGIIYGFSLTNNTEPVTGVDFSYCTGLKYAGMSSVNGSSRKQFGTVASSLAPSTITEVRAVDVVLGTDPQSYYSVTYNPQYYNGWYWNGGGGDLAGQQMSGAALDQFYTDLISDAGDPSLGTLIVSNNPGTSSDDPTIATGKGYTVSG